MTAQGTPHVSVTSRQMMRAQIRAARGFLDWTVRDLGKKAKVYFNTVHAIESGKSNGRPETLAAIRKVLEKAGFEFINGKRPGVRIRDGKKRQKPADYCLYAISYLILVRDCLATVGPRSIEQRRTSCASSASRSRRQSAMQP